jgi:AcrR family transcriptional regulator
MRRLSDCVPPVHEFSRRGAISPTQDLHSTSYSDTLLYVNGHRLNRRESQRLTRAKLIESAERVFVRAGFDAASVERIAEEAGFSRGAFYSNFKSKDELFLELLDKKRIETQNALDGVFRENHDANARFQAARDWYADQCRQRVWTVIRTEFNLRALRKRALRKRLSALWRQEVDTYSALLVQYCLEAGLEPAESPQSIVAALLAAAQGLGMMALLGSDSALESTVAESQKLAFDRLVPAPPSQAPVPSNVTAMERGNL